MGLIDRLYHFLGVEPVPVQTRAGVLEAPSWDQQMARIRQSSERPWRGASVREALGVPAVLRAVTLISNMVGALSLDAFRNGERLADRPRLIVRPNPFGPPRNFFRDTAYAIATRGESWWWVPVRDLDGYALSLYPVNPVEVRVEENPDDPRYPRIYWRNRLMPNRDMVQITLLQEPGELRGVGPLQLAGAAVSVAVEAQEWAANFYAAGGYPNVILKSDYEFENEEEPTLLKQRWTSNPPNTPQILGGGLDVQEMSPNPQGAQMLDARLHQNGEVALMFGIPGTLLEHGVQGATITYQNVGGEFDKFVRACLWPNYLEPIEQAFTDLLPRATVARFNLKGLLRPDAKTRFEMYKLGADAGLPWVADMAAREEGEAPGDIEVAPIPAAPPIAFPSAASIPTRAAAAEPVELRCDGMTTKRRHGVSRLEKCNRLLSPTGIFVGTCPRCKKAYEAAA